MLGLPNTGHRAQPQNAVTGILTVIFLHLSKMDDKPRKCTGRGVVSTLPGGPYVVNINSL